MTSRFNDEAKSPVARTRRAPLIVLIAALVVLVVVIAGGKHYMDRKAQERLYQDGMQQVQEVFTEYLVKNYAGIDAVEWQGVGVEWWGSPMLGDIVISDARVYVNDEDYIKMDLFLHDATDFDRDRKRYILNGVLSTQNMDGIIKVELHNSTYQLTQEGKLAFDEFVKSEAGSPDAKVTYDLEVHELTY